MLLRVGGGHERAPVDPARHGRRHPRPRPRQDQRRLRLRRRGARRSRRSSSTSGIDGQPPHRGQLRRTSRSSSTRMGGIDYTGGCVVSKINGGYAQRRRARCACAAARRTSTATRRSRSPARARTPATRARTTSPARAASSSIVAAMKSRTLSPAGFVRAPWIAWHAPKAIRTDMSGPTLAGVFAAMAIGGTPTTARARHARRQRAARPGLGRRAPPRRCSALPGRR